MLPLAAPPRSPFVFLAALALAACSSDRDIGPPGDGEIGAACTQDDDCDSSWCLIEKSFKDNYCSLQCGDDPNVCPEGSTCHDYAGFKFCLRQCNADGDCREGYVCDYNLCIPPCAADKFCNEGDTCLNGRCKGKCASDADCGDGLRCQDGKCVPPCKTDTDCLPGYTCDTAAGTCKPKPGKPMGQGCASDGECATGYCLPTRRICSIKCQSTSQCPSSYSCGLETYDKDYNGTQESALAGCVPVKGSKIAGEHCSQDADCAAGHCYNGFCMEGCIQDGDCVGTDLQCVTVNILLPGGVPTYNGCLPRVGISSYTLGTVSGTELGTYKGVDIPPTAASFILSTEVQSISEIGAVALLKDPNGLVLTGTATDSCEVFSEPNRYRYDVQYSSLFVPITPSVKIVPGIYTYAVSASQAGLPVTVKLRLKLGTAQKGTLNLNYYFLNLANSCVPGGKLDAASAPTHSWFGKVRSDLATIMGKANLTIGKVTYQDINDPSLDVIEVPPTGVGVEFQKLFSSSQGQSGDSINVFFVRNITDSGMTGGIILGLAGGIPGPAGVHGTVHSGVSMSMQTACFQAFGLNPAHTLAHELGHYLGLSHNLENTLPGMLDGQIYCPCPCGANLSCVTPSSGGSYCRGMDPIPDTNTSPDNLMFWAAESTQTFKGNQLSPGQVRVMLDNPVVGH